MNPVTNTLQMSVTNLGWAYSMRSHQSLLKKKRRKKLGYLAEVRDLERGMKNQIVR